MARRARIRKRDVLNALPPDELAAASCSARPRSRRAPPSPRGSRRSARSPPSPTSATPRACTTTPSATASCGRPRGSTATARLRPSSRLRRSSRTRPRRHSRPRCSREAAPPAKPASGKQRDKALDEIRKTAKKRTTTALRIVTRAGRRGQRALAAEALAALEAIVGSLAGSDEYGAAEALAYVPGRARDAAALVDDYTSASVRTASRGRPRARRRARRRRRARAHRARRGDRNHRQRGPRPAGADCAARRDRSRAASPT